MQRLRSCNSASLSFRREAGYIVTGMTKTGHVYIISNIGSFGENVYKIEIICRLEPMDRVKEVTPPFPFRLTFTQ